MKTKAQMLYTAKLKSVIGKVSPQYGIMRGIGYINDQAYATPNDLQIIENVKSCNKWDAVFNAMEDDCQRRMKDDRGNRNILKAAGY